MSEELPPLPPLLERHLARFNQGVRSGDFGPMVAQFAPTAELAFEGIPVGPFIGRDAIAAAYTSQPPDDEIGPLAVWEEEGRQAVTYAWLRQPDVPAGEMVIEVREGQIARLLVRYGLVTARDLR